MLIVTGQPDSFDPNISCPGCIGTFGSVYAISMQSDGRILIGGFFRMVGSQSRYNVARLDPNTGSPDNFDPHLVNTVQRISQQSDGTVLVAGPFSYAGTERRNGIARLEPDGRLDTNLNIIASGDHISAVAVQPDGKMLIGGSFNRILRMARANIARLNADGTLDVTFDPSANGPVTSIAVQPDGRILVGGAFDSIGGQARSFLGRLNSDGTADEFDPSPNGEIRTLALQTDNKIIVGGSFDVIGGEQRNSIARLNASGTVDAFDPSANGVVDTTVIQYDGKILVGGQFTSIGGNPRNYIARLDPVTGSSDAFDPNANDRVTVITVQPDGLVLAGGLFTVIGGQVRTHIARLVAETGAADDFAPNATDEVKTIAIQADGKILAGGRFHGQNSIGQRSRDYLARLDPLTGVSDGFDAHASGPVLGIAIRGDGKVLTFGSFSSIGGRRRNLFARLTNDTAVRQELSASPTSVRWTRGGPASQFSRVNFEYSASGVDYSPLGDGTPVGPDWALTGISLPPDTAFFIRARGSFRSGLSNGSESANEAVKRFVPGAQAGASPSPTPIPSPTVVPIPTATPSPIATPSPGCFRSESFDDAGALVQNGWFEVNHSADVGSTGWFQGNIAIFPAQSGNLTSYIAADFNNTTGTNPISNWLITPPLELREGSRVVFYTRTEDTFQFPDRLQVRMSTNGLSVNVGTTAEDMGDFSTLLLDINPNYGVEGYPKSWRRYDAVVSGLQGATTGRLAFRYFVENGGPTGANSDYIGIDSVQFSCATPTPTPAPTCPTPSPTPGQPVVPQASCGGTMPTPTPTPTPTPSPTPSCLPSYGIGVGCDAFVPAFGDISNHCDDCETTITLPFPVQLYDRYFTEISLDSNGRAEFPAGSSEFSNTCLPQVDETFSIYPYWDDLRTDAMRGACSQYPNGFCGILATVSGTAPNRTFTIEWRTIYFSNEAQRANFEIQFTEGQTTFRVIYGTVDQGNTSATAGVQRDTDRFTQSFCNGGLFPAVGNHVYYLQGCGIPTPSADPSPSCVVTPFPTPSPTPPRAFDYEGDRRSDISVFRPADGTWYLLRSRDGFAGVNFGVATDRITPADFDGDGKTDVAVYRAETGTWYWLNSSNGAFNAAQFGASEDLPTPADHDGDGRADISVFRPSNGTWYRLNSSNGAFVASQFGVSEDKPTVGDFDGDGMADIAVWRPSNGAWYRLNSSNGAFVAVSFGLSDDLITPADFDGDGATDIAVYRPSTGTWYSLNSSNGALIATQFGTAEDQPTAADYDGDGRADISVFRPSDGVWYRLNSSNGGFVAMQFGVSGDRPTPAAFRY